MDGKVFPALGVKSCKWTKERRVGTIVDGLSIVRQFMTAMPHLRRMIWILC